MLKAKESILLNSTLCLHVQFSNGRDATGSAQSHAHNRKSGIESRHPELAIILGLAERPVDGKYELLPEDARALVRIALSKVYSAFSAVDLQAHEWSPHRPYLETLQAVRRALMN